MIVPRKIIEPPSAAERFQVVTNSIVGKVADTPLKIAMDDGVVARGAYDANAARRRYHDPVSFNVSLQGHPEFETVLSWIEQARHQSLLNPHMPGAHGNIAKLFITNEGDALSADVREPENLGPLLYMRFMQKINPAAHPILSEFAEEQDFDDAVFDMVFENHRDLLELTRQDQSAFLHRFKYFAQDYFAACLTEADHPLRYAIRENYSKPLEEEKRRQARQELEEFRRRQQAMQDAIDQAIMDAIEEKMKAHPDYESFKQQLDDISRKINDLTRDMASNVASLLSQMDADDLEQKAKSGDKESVEDKIRSSQPFQDLVSQTTDYLNRSPEMMGQDYQNNFDKQFVEELLLNEITNNFYRQLEQKLKKSRLFKRIVDGAKNFMASFGHKEMTVEERREPSVAESSPQPFIWMDEAYLEEEQPKQTQPTKYPEPRADYRVFDRSLDRKTHARTLLRNPDRVRRQGVGGDLEMDSQFNLPKSSKTNLFRHAAAARRDHRNRSDIGKLRRVLRKGGVPVSDTGLMPKSYIGRHLDSGSLARIVASATGAVPEDIYVDDRQERAQSDLPSITLLVDMGAITSSCTYGQKNTVLTFQHSMLLVAAEEFERAGYPVEILGYTTVSPNEHESSENWRAKGSPKNPGRVDAIQHIVLKDFDDRAASVKEAPDLLVDGVGAYTPIEGEALEWAAERARQRSEGKHIILHAFDGFVNNHTLDKFNRDDYTADHYMTVLRALRDDPAMKTSLIRLKDYFFDGFQPMDQEQTAKGYEYVLRRILPEYDHAVDVNVERDNPYAILRQAVEPHLKSNGRVLVIKPEQPFARKLAVA
jgi:hypothetical protein